MKDQIVLRGIGKLFIPLILLFAFYVLFHGDYGPGGGFQAGVIFAAAFVLHMLIFGLEETEKVAKPNLVLALTAVGVLLYTITGLMGILLGGNFLDYNVFRHHDPVHGQHIGILFIELGVGITVASVIITIIFSFAKRTQL